jgi:CheY-like chemotaxis protein
MLDSSNSGPESGSSLLRQLAHEMRDALSPLASSADLARLRNFDSEASRLLVEKVERGLRRALAVLDTFVLAEQCENGSLQLTIGRITLAEIVQSARETLAEPERARYRFVAGDAGLAVQADRSRSAEALVAVLRQLTAQGAPDCLVEVSFGTDAAQSWIRVRGRMAPHSTPPDEWFASWRGAADRVPVRTARCLMRLQHGDLELRSDTGGDCELLMSFAGEAGPAEGMGREQPAGKPAERAPPGPSAGEVGGSILIVDDSREVRRAYREALVALGYRVAEAADAEQALRALDEQTPDVALIDIHLPRMNGYRLAQAIRTRAGAAIYLVMLSGMALDAVSRQLAREAGFDDCLDKMAGPVALRELLLAGKRNSLGSGES